MRTVVVNLVLGAALATSAIADPPAALSPAAQKAVDAWRATYAEARTRAAAKPNATPLDELDARVRIEQAGQQALVTVLTSDLNAADLAAAKTAIWTELGPPAVDNAAFLKTIMPVDASASAGRAGARR